MNHLPSVEGPALEGEETDRGLLLPRGRHGLPRELIARNQRERMIVAMAEVVAERGYAETTVAEVIARARVSRRTFYEQFNNRQDCMLASFHELFERLCQEIDDACEPEPDSRAKVRAAIRRALELFAAQPPVARLLTLEILAAGPQGASNQHAAIERLAARLEAARDLGDRSGVSAFNLDWGLVALIATLIARRIIAGEPERLPELESELAQLALAPYWLVSEPTDKPQE